MYLADGGRVMIMRVLQILGGLIAIYVAGFLLFVATLPVRPTQTLTADGIVALTGGDARVDAAWRCSKAASASGS